jgi:hypothetical protein
MTRVRPITPADRFLAWERDFDRGLDKAPSTRPRRRSHRRAGTLDIVVIEELDRPTRILLCEGGEKSGDPFIETTVERLRQALAYIDEIVAQPPPRKKPRAR